MIFCISIVWNSKGIKVLKRIDYLKAIDKMIIIILLEEEMAMNKRILYFMTGAVIISLFVAGCGSTSDEGTSEVAAVEGEQTQITPEQKTLDSLTKLSDGVYMMDCYTDYKLDDYLAANITDVEQFDIWMTQNLTEGIPTGDIPDMGCSSFAVTDNLGNHLFGRNYDMTSGESMIIRTVPENGYKSIGIVDLMHINIGNHGQYSLEDEQAKSLLFAAPWCICDGINEKGLGVSLLELSDKHVVEDTEKENLLIYSVLRVILDRCTSVEEAIELLKSYDMYSPRPNTYHVFLTDTSGRAVVVEWADNETFCIEDTAATNFALYKERTTFTGDPRYIKIHNKIETADCMTMQESMSLLDEVHQRTRWSAVYNLDKFSVDVCFNEDYSKCFSYSGIFE